MIVRLTPEQAKARLQPTGKAKAKGKQPTLDDGIQPIIGTWKGEDAALPIPYLKKQSLSLNRLSKPLTQ